MGVVVEKISVLIVDDHTVAREGLRAMLETTPLVKVVGEVADGAEAIEHVAKLRPGVVLMDIRMPRMDGLEATRRIKTEFPDTAVIIITSYDDDPIMVEAVVAGASGYLLKDASRDLLNHTLNVVANGGILIKDTQLRKVVSTLAGQARQHDAESRPLGQTEKLTGREQDILMLVADGHTNKEISDSLALAEVTVKKHVQSIIAKLRASDRTQAATLALRTGLIK